MQFATTIGNSQGFHDVVNQIAGLEKAGLDAVWLAENSGFDAPSRLGDLAARTERLRPAAHAPRAAGPAAHPDLVGGDRREERCPDGRDRRRLAAALRHT